MSYDINITISKFSAWDEATTDIGDHDNPEYKAVEAYESLENPMDSLIDFFAHQKNEFIDNMTCALIDDDCEYFQEYVEKFDQLFTEFHDMLIKEREMIKGFGGFARDVIRDREAEDETRNFERWRVSQ